MKESQKQLDSSLFQPRRSGRREESFSALCSKVHLVVEGWGKAVTSASRRERKDRLSLYSFGLFY